MAEDNGDTGMQSVPRLYADVTIIAMRMLRSDYYTRMRTNDVSIEFRRGFCTLVSSLSCVSVYVSVCLSVPALAASASVEDSKQRYSRVSLRLFLDFDSWIFEKPFHSKVIARKSQYAN